MEKKILVIGSSNVDMIMKMEHLPKPGETVTDCSFIQVFGGKGANQAVGAARAGGLVTFVTCLGNDYNAFAMISNFKKDKINVDHIIKENGIACGTALIMIGSHGENYISVAPGANYRLTKEMIDQIIPLIAEASLVMLQYEILPETLEYIIEKCHKSAKAVMLNLAPARNISHVSLKRTKYLVVNETEAQFLSGMPIIDTGNIGQALKVLKNLGPEIVIITLGENGSFIQTPSETFKVPAFRVNAVDTTAAGDVYCGTLAAALSEEKNLHEAVTMASAAAAIAVTRMGAQPSAPYRNEIDEFIKNYVAH
ncbi:MAG TPA: ribokinase [Cyclobacteriaceae bacterium]|nr:ribokinase [Cyclobacteriaceae bacterium]